jgi:hypothetical protein
MTKKESARAAKIELVVPCYSCKRDVQISRDIKDGYASLLHDLSCDAFLEVDDPVEFLARCREAMEGAR